MPRKGKRPRDRLWQHIGSQGDPLTAYVAVTRVTGRNNLAILRPFDPKPYQQGTRLGRVLLLKVWRGEEIDWDVLRAKYLEEKPCAECTVQKRKNEYTAGQWKRNDEKRICKECVVRHVENGEPWQCSVCCCWRGPAQFPAKHQKPSCAFYRVCLTCKELKKCDLCGQHLEEKTSARGSGGGGSVDSVYAQRANEKDTGHALFANDGCCKHTFHFGEESTRDTTVDSNVTCAYT